MRVWCPGELRNMRRWTLKLCSVITGAAYLLIPCCNVHIALVLSFSRLALKLDFLETVDYKLLFRFLKDRAENFGIFRVHVNITFFFLLKLFCCYAPTLTDDKTEVLGAQK